MVFFWTPIISSTGWVTVQPLCLAETTLNNSSVTTPPVSAKASLYWRFDVQVMQWRFATAFSSGVVGRSAVNSLNICRSRWKHRMVPKRTSGCKSLTMPQGQLTMNKHRRMTFAAKENVNLTKMPAMMSSVLTSSLGPL